MRINIKMFQGLILLMVLLTFSGCEYKPGEVPSTNSTAAMSDSAENLPETITPILPTSTEELETAGTQPSTGMPSESSFGPENTSQETGDPEQAEKILEIANSYDLEEKEGLVIAKHTAGNSGPRDFAVIAWNDILVLQTSRLRLQRYVNNRYQKTYVFQEADNYEFVETDGEYAYVIGWEKLLRVDLNTGEEESIPYPPAMRAPTAVWADGYLVLQSESCGNYVYNKITGALDEVNQGFTTEWKVSSNYTTVLIKYGNSSWKLDATEIINVPIAVDGSGNLIIYVTNEKRKNAEDHTSVQTIAPTGRLQAKVNVDQSNHFFTPLKPVKMQKDGKVYIMCVYEPYTAIYALPATDCTVSEPDIPVPVR